VLPAQAMLAVVHIHLGLLVTILPFVFELCVPLVLRLASLSDVPAQAQRKLKMFSRNGQPHNNLTITFLN
jgi:hypothetical protein